MSIAQSIVELAEEVAIKEQAGPIQSIDIEIGALSGVVLEALEFAMEISVKNTKLEKAKINYRVLPGKARCRECNREFETNDLLALCPGCKQANYTITDGKQLRIKSLVV
ncbi:hydrogenase maturation nickel metallochaperone HypA [Prolixibacteraceae bacterium Z1-6]|uniref:Hydrogenase maturation nickel metallochaperone HypA n=1 Tax=Draconibacterium aestuarii TaxID=2998507 RepID=A0A9X3FDQ5_9BACT|nr:hydrogenase maturation nickel metallochaperone HypA [Prolixibacteraceae bacterium Z1-6]